MPERAVREAGERLRPDRFLLVFDGGIDPGAIAGLGPLLPDRAAGLFPLTSDWRVIRSVEAELRRQGGRADLLPSAREVDGAVAALRERIGAWSAGLGRRMVAGRSVREWLLTRRGEVSAWWFSPLSEKNTLKTDVFLRVAQLSAIERALSSGTFAVCAVALAEGPLRRAVLALARRLGVDARVLPSSARARAGLSSRIARFLRGAGTAGMLLLAARRLASFAIEGFRARRRLGSLMARRPGSPDLLVVSYFPAVDQAAAEKGVFKNKYFHPLQDLAREGHRSLAWVLLFVAMDGRDFRAGLDLAARFRRAGEEVWFLAEFLSISGLARVAGAWGRQVVRYAQALRRVREEELGAGLGPVEAGVLLRGAWRDSILGPSALAGLASFEAFRSAAAYFRGARDCLYLCEMHAWEKGLLAAFREAGNDTRTIAFQHTSMARNYFFYFHDPSEVAESASRGGLPLPDVLATNGPVPARLLERSGYPGLRHVEAIRQFPLVSTVRGVAEERPRERMLLVACSIDREETEGLLSLLVEAFPGKPDFAVRVKAHPAVPVEPILERLSIGPERSFEIASGSIYDHLARAVAVLAGTSTVALEAVAFGCRVIVPVLPDRLSMTLLDGHEEYYARTYDPEALRDEVERAFREPPGEEARRRAREFAANYWHLDPALPRWRALFLGD